MQPTVHQVIKGGKVKNMMEIVMTGLVLASPLHFKHGDMCEQIGGIVYIVDRDECITKTDWNMGDHTQSKYQILKGKEIEKAVPDC